MRTSSFSSATTSSTRNSLYLYLCLSNSDSFSFPVLKIYRISSGTYQRRWRSEYQKENVKQEWKIVTQFKIQDTKCFKSTDL